MNLSGETKLLLVLGLIVVFGAGALIGIKGLPGGPDAPPPTPPPPLVMDAARFDSIVKDAKHIKEAPGAEVTVIEFADFECKSCRRAYGGNLGKTLKDPKRPIRLVFKHFPLENHQFAIPTATAAEAAAKQGKFWEMYAALFEGVDEFINDDFILNVAKKVGLNMEQFQKDWKSQDIRKLVEDDRAQAIELGTQFTPTFVVKDKTGKVESVVGNDEFEDIMGNIFEGKPRKPKASPTPPAGAVPPGASVAPPGAGAAPTVAGAAAPPAGS